VRELILPRRRLKPQEVTDTVNSQFNLSMRSGYQPPSGTSLEYDPVFGGPDRARCPASLKFFGLDFSARFLFPPAPLDEFNVMTGQ